MFDIPNCVPEYYRSRFEDEAYEAEKEFERYNWYEKNKRYRKEKYLAGYTEIWFYPDECEGCPHSEEAMPSSEDDDIPCVICSNWRTCPVWRKDFEESFPGDDIEEAIKRHDELVEEARKEAEKENK